MGLAILGMVCGITASITGMYSGCIGVKKALGYMCVLLPVAFIVGFTEWDMEAGIGLVIGSVISFAAGWFVARRWN